MASVTSELSDEDWLSSGSLSNKLPVHVGVGRGIGFDQIAGCRPPFTVSTEVPIFRAIFDFHRHGGPHVHVLLAALESGRRGAEVIVVVGNVIELEVSLLRRSAVFLVVAGNRILDFHRGALDGGARGIQHRAANGS